MFLKRLLFYTKIIRRIEKFFDWQRPSEILTKQKEDQLTGSVNLLTSWGSDKDSVTRYLDAVEEAYKDFKKGKKVAIGAAVVAGALLTYKLASKGNNSPYKYNSQAYRIPINSYFNTTYLGNASGGTGKWWGSGGSGSGNNIIADGNASTTAFYSYTNGDILMFAMDNDNGKLWFGKNGTCRR